MYSDRTKANPGKLADRSEWLQVWHVGLANRRAALDLHLHRRRTQRKEIWTVEVASLAASLPINSFALLQKPNTNCPSCQTPSLPMVH